MAKIFSYDEIKLKVSCEDYLSRIGVQVRNGRCRASWRGGESNDSVHVDGAKWFDFVEKQGGSVIDLCARAEFNGDAVQAVTRLGEMFNLEPVRVTKARPKKSTFQSKLDAGYAHIATYDYTDENGQLVYSVIRLEKDKDKCAPGEKPKTFLQRTPEHEGLDEDTPRLPYNLPAVVNSSRVVLVEGEKDVETLRGLGIVGSCNSGGACNWDPSTNKWFAGKDIVIIPDNDEAGEKHCKIVTAFMKTVARSVKVLPVISTKPKGDVTDWVNEEGGSGQKLNEMMLAAKEVDAEMSPELAVAKQANETEFRNYEIVGTGKGEKKIPLTLGHLIEECHTRFLGFPKKLGETLFDWNRDRHAVDFLTNKEAVFSWMALLSRHNVVFESGAEFVNKSEFFEGLILRAVPYSSISNVPHYPSRTDVFYTYGKLPPPDITHSSFWRLVNMFSVADDANRTLLAAFLAAPIFYEPTADRPMWAIDTEDQQGSGKTSLVKLCALLYDSEYISIDVGQLDRDIQQVRRRLVTTDARRKRVAVFDNITKTLSSGNLASLITEGYITGLAPYGRSEETRPNDLTYAVTVNNANFSDDIASRVYTVKVKKVTNPSPTWLAEVAAFICENRLQILSDIIHMMDNNLLASSNVRRSRFGRFDSKVLSAVCRSEREYIAADAALRKANDAANTDMDHGAEFYELFLERMRACTPQDVQTRILIGNASQDDIQSVVDPEKAIFVSSADIDWILEHSDGELQKWKARGILGLVKNGHVKGFDRKVERINGAYKCFDGTPLHRYRGFLYRPDPLPGRVNAQVLRRRGANFSVIAIAQFVVGANDAGANAVEADAETIAPQPAQTVRFTQTRTATETQTVEMDVETAVEMGL